MKVIAFTCCSITVILLLGALGDASWVQSDGWREGLFTQCVKVGAPTPLPFGADPTPGCRRAHSAGYVRGAAALMIIGFLTDFFGTLLTGLGLRSTDPNKKYKYYRVAIYAFTAAVIALFLALINYPTSFSKDMENEPRLNGARVRAPINTGSLDFDGDGIIDSEDNDDDNDGVPDDIDTDDDNDGIVDALDDDDDKDGIPDAFDNDSDGDGQIDAFDNDDDGDGIDDSEEYGDGDGTPDNLDNDDDNDGIPDTEDSLDSDGDGISDEEDGDDDGDGIADHLDNEDDNDGIPDSEDLSGHRRVWEFGFGFGASWASLIFIFVSLVLLIRDRESEEIFYKERDVEEGDEEGKEED